MRKRGRPPFKATATRKRKVEQYVAGCMSQADVARAIGCSLRTLHNHFEEELANGAAKRRAECIDLLYAAARKGNVSAIKRLHEMAETAAASEEIDKPLPNPGKLGKKERAAAEAVTAGEGSEWGDDLCPPEPHRYN